MICLTSTSCIATFCRNPWIFLSKSLLRYLSTSAPWGTTAERNVPSSKFLKQDTSASSTSTKPLPKHADVVIMGGGSLGCHTLYHLAKMGIADVVLLERDQLTSGTTWHTAGLLWQLRPSDTEIELLKHTRDVVSKDLGEETGLHTGWIENGGLFIASNKQRLDEYKRLMSLGKVYGIESFVLSPAETKDLYPLMNVDDLCGTLYVPTDGTMDPAGTCSTLARAATARGASVIENCPVTGIQVKVDHYGTRRVTGVETDCGTIQTTCVINCAGVWARALGEMAGVNVPLIGMRHAYVVTERIEGIRNMPNVRDHDSSVYLRLQGDALSVGGYEPNPNFWEEVSDKFAFSLFDLDWDVFTQLIEGAMNRIPALETTGVKSTVCGPESFTADHKPLMGEAPELRGYYLGCGFNSAGMMLGGGCGKELAHWVIHGRPEKDMYGYDIRRFHHSLTNNNRWIRERSHESYAKNYSVVFPYDEPLAGRNMRLDPLHQELLQQGCVFQERHGWERPGWFNPKGPAPILNYDYYGFYGNKRHEDYRYNQLLCDDYTFDFPPHHNQIKSECESCRNAAAVFDMSYFGKFYLLGPDAKKAADWLFTADVSVSSGKTMYTCMLNSRGGTESDLTVSPIESAPQGTALTPAFEGYRHWHADLRSDDTPLEAGLAFTCKLKTKIPFLGREMLEKQKAEGLFKRLLCFTVDEKVPMFGLEVIWRNGKVVGHIRRADFAFTLDKTIAYGYIRDPDGGVVTPDFVKRGEYSLERMGVSYPAKVHLKSPFDPNNKRVKGIYS
ncbi:sarcosine dehydrogenase, mitochondrial isoform X2 [Stegostoma tigrinum]|uniref:sarcosine dehydrogenase, mitochondrial isoform X2 n=1 Tax=Stegostoma tigrinum TaxID=3053191 RepID=UPI0028701082|nr:sarcosine dehydrogenase, mitochondrial isoform X2 [Stegostoma tigrinum]